MKLTTAQQVDLIALAEAHEEVMTAKRLLRAQIEAEFEKRFDDLLRKRSRAANAALAAGVSKSRVGRAMGTTNWPQINEVLALTETERVTEQTADRYLIGDGWSFDTETLTFELTAWRHRHTKKIEKRTLTVPMHKVEVMDGYGKRSTILRAVNNKADLYDLGVDDQDWFRPVVVAEVEALIGLRDPEPEQAPGPLPITTDYGYGDPSTWGTAEDEDDDE